VYNKTDINNGIYIELLLCHFNLFYITDDIICLITHKMFYTQILLSVIYFGYTTYSICISSNSDESKKLPGDGRLLPKHVAVCVLNKGVARIQCIVLVVKLSINCASRVLSYKIMKDALFKY
jgi:hypothetical protein